VLILLLLYAYVVRARLEVGYWPHPYRPQSYRLGFTWHFWLLRPWFYFVPAPVGCLPIIGGIYTIGLWAVTRRFPRRLFAVLVVSTAVVFTCLIADPGSFVAWFQD